MSGLPSAATETAFGPTNVLSAYAALLLVVPSAYTLGSYAVTTAMIVGLAAFMLWCGGLVLPDQGVTLGSSPAQRAVLVFLALILLSYLVAAVRPLDDLSAGAADRHLVGLLAVAGAGLLAADGIRRRDELQRVIGCLVVGGGVIALIGILQYVADVDLAHRIRPPGFASADDQVFIYVRAGFDRVAGTARHPIEFGIMCASLLPLALHLSAHAATTARRRASLVVAVLLGVALPMALSRSAVLAAAAALAVMLPTLPPPRRRRLIAGIGVVMLSVAVLAPGVLTTVRELFFGDAASASNAARSTAWQAAIDLFAERPWFGYGFGAFQGFIVDNQLFVTLIESGVVGVLGLIVLANGALLSVRIVRRSTGDAGLRDLGRALVAVIAALAVGSSGLGTLRYPTTAGLLFLSIGLAGALYAVAAGDTSAREEPHLARQPVPVQR
jgi:hypothetical protein